jgi:hypothetical protein
LSHLVIAASPKRAWHKLRKEPSGTNLESIERHEKWQSVKNQKRRRL